MKVFIHVDRIDAWTKLHVLPAPGNSGELREYHIARSPYRALIVIRGNLSLGNVLGRYVDALSGVDRADVGFARVPGYQQSKLTIFRVVSRSEATQHPVSVQTMRLSQWLRRARKDPPGWEPPDNE